MTSCQNICLLLHSAVYIKNRDTERRRRRSPRVEKMGWAAEGCILTVICCSSGLVCPSHESRAGSKDMGVTVMKMKSAHTRTMRSLAQHAAEYEHETSGRTAEGKHQTRIIKQSWSIDVVTDSRIIHMFHLLVTAMEQWKSHAQTGSPPSFSSTDSVCPPQVRNRNWIWGRNIVLVQHIFLPFFPPSC